MPNRTIYIRNEDVEKWDGLSDKSEHVHQMLIRTGTSKEITDDWDNSDDTLGVAKTEVKEPEEGDEEETDFYDGLIWYPDYQQVVNENTREPLEEFDKGMVKELIKRGQVKNV